MKTPDDHLKIAIEKYSPRISFDDWKENYPSQYAVHVEAMKSYAFEACKATLEKAAENAKPLFEAQEFSEIDKETITDPSNIIIIK